MSIQPIIHITKHKQNQNKINNVDQTSCFQWNIKRKCIIYNGYPIACLLHVLQN